MFHLSFLQLVLIQMTLNLDAVELLRNGQSLAPSFTISCVQMGQKEPGTQTRIFLHSSTIANVNNAPRQRQLAQQEQ
jgi:hypothetical protein